VAWYDAPTFLRYDFNNDLDNPPLRISLRPDVVPRSYQSKSLSKVFGNRRARSGIIVLPCGAGKTLVGITAICTIRKSALVLAPNVLSVNQWMAQVRFGTSDGLICAYRFNSLVMCPLVLQLGKFTTIDQADIRVLTSKSKDRLPPPTQACVLISTYTMMGYTGCVASGAPGRQMPLLFMTFVMQAPKRGSSCNYAADPRERMGCAGDGRSACDACRSMWQPVYHALVRRMLILMLCFCAPVVPSCHHNDKSSLPTWVDCHGSFLVCVVPSLLAITLLTTLSVGAGGRSY